MNSFIPLIIESTLESIEFDRAATLWINSHSCAWSDAFWAAMSGKAIWIPLYLAMAALLVWRLGWKKGLVCIGALVLSFFCSERICGYLKDVFERVRPCMDEGMLAAGLNVLEGGGGFSFPSHHACNCVGLVTGFIYCLGFDEKKKWHWVNVLLVVWVVLICISRIMCGKHFLGDVLVGSMLGVGLGLAFGFIADWVIEKWIDKE